MLCFFSLIAGVMILFLENKNIFEKRQEKISIFSELNPECFGLS